MDLVIRHLARTKGPWRHRSHRKAVVLELGKRGFSAAKDALYTHFNPRDDFRFADEIIELDGLVGLDWLISRSLNYLRSDVWKLRWWIEDLENARGKEAVAEWLDRESLTRPEIAELVQLATQEPVHKKREKQAAISFEAFQEQWHLPNVPRPSPLSWAMTASEDELKKAWRAFESEDDLEWLRRIAIGLRRKPEHCDIGKIIVRARAWTQEPNPFVRAIEDIADPRLRQLGFELIASSRIIEGISLLWNNALPGDEPAILAAIVPLSDDWDVHSVAMDMLKLGKDLDIREHLIWVYENSPCSLCRNSAVRDLIEINQAPDSILQECLLDCDTDLRKLAEDALV